MRVRTRYGRTLLWVVGCLSLTGFPPLALGGTKEAVSLPPEVTYAGEIAPILNARCVACHRRGGMAPMSLITYGEARPWAKAIARQVRLRSMPPWHADPRYGKFENDRSLSDGEVALIDLWVRNGAPLGDAKLLSPVPEPPQGWSLGEPDHIVELDEVTVPAQGPDFFPDLSAPLDLPRDRWVRAVEIQPSHPQVVHHAIVYTLGEGDLAPQTGWLGGWAAGLEPMVFPAGTGRLISRGSRLAADVHYHPNGTEVRERTRIGLYFHQREPDKELVNLWVQDAGIRIPAGEDDHEVRASHTFRQDVRVYSLLPHMHYRGKDFTYTVRYPDGGDQVLLKVNDYDFNWQTAYHLAEPLELPKGSRIECVAHFDNSAGNPANPDPTREVLYGKGSTHEMMIGFVDYVVKEGQRPLPAREVLRRILAEMALAHPGEVYSVDLNQGLAVLATALHLPPQGEGKWVLPMRGQIYEGRLYGLKRHSSSYSARMETPIGTFDVQGEARQEGKELVGTVYMGASELAYRGFLVP